MMMHHIKKITFVCCISGFFSASIAVTPVEKHGWLTTRGTNIVNKTGNIVQLRGMSFYWSTTTTGWSGYKYYNESTVNTLAADWKCTVVRAAYDRNEGNNSGGDGVD